MSEQGTDKRSAFYTEQEKSEQNVISAGAQLAAFREQRGWTVEQVASQLNLAPRQIVALESDDYPALPGMPIVRGFIRAYAKLLKVDPVPMLEALGGQTVPSSESLAPRQTLSAPFSEARLPIMGQRQGTTKWVFGFLLVLLVGVAFWAAQQRDGVTTSTQAPPPEARENIGSGQAADTFVSNEASVNAEPAETEAASQAEAVPELALQAASEIPSSNEAPVDAAPGLAASSQESNLAEANALVFQMREESWLEVRRTKDDGIVVSRLVGAGETERVQMAEPVTVVIGNAAGVDVTLRGKPMELNASTRTNVARLNLK